LLTLPDYRAIYNNMAKDLTVMKTILIIDDDPVVCALLRSFLSLKKYKVASYSRLEDALKALESSPADVVLTDMKMQGIVGAEIIRKVLGARPDLKLIAMSGDTSFDKLPPEIKATVPFLRKPFRLQEVERLLLDLFNQESKGQQSH